MDLPVELRALRAFAALIRDGIPFSEAYRIVAREKDFAFYAAAGEKLMQGAPLVDTFPGLPPAFRSILRWGERSGQPTQAVEHIARWWMAPNDPRLPLAYLGCALGSGPLEEVLPEGKDVFEVDREWTAFAADLDRTLSFSQAASGKTRILPRPLDAVLAAAERSGNLADLFTAIWDGSQRGMIPTEGPKSGKQSFYCWSLLITAGVPVQESLVALAPVFPEFAPLRADDFVPSLEGTFTPSIRALLKKAYECGNMARTLRRIAEEIDQGWLPVP